MRNMEELDLEVLTIKEFVSFIKPKFPDFADALEVSQIVNEDLKLYKASYKYGSNIVKNKNVFVTLKNGQNVALSSSKVPVEIAKDIIGSDMGLDPLGMIIEHAAEIYLEKQGAIFRKSVLPPGEFFGVPRALDPANKKRTSCLDYDISSGSRSLFMIQKISNKQLYQKINKELRGYIYCPDRHEEHVKTFASIAISYNSSWRVEVIYFSRKFIELLSLPKFAALYVYLNNKHTSFYGVRHSLITLWHVLYFSSIEKNSQIHKYSSSYVNIIKHVFLVANNDELAFSPATDDLLFPYAEVKEFFNKRYGLKFPVIMIPVLFNFNDPNQQRVYLSLSFQEPMIPILGESTRKTKIYILEEIKLLLSKYLTGIKGEKAFESSILNIMQDVVEFGFFHNSQDIKNSSIIQQALDVVKDDIRFSGVDDLELEALSASQFFSGGMVLSLKK